MVDGQRLQNAARFMNKYRTREGWLAGRAPSPEARGEAREAADSWDEVLHVQSALDEMGEMSTSHLQEFFFTSKLVQRFEHVLVQVRPAPPQPWCLPRALLNAAEVNRGSRYRRGRSS